jgi:chlorophyllide a reductase subunit Y
VREFEAARRPVVGSAPVGRDGTADWLDEIGRTFSITEERIAASKNRFLPVIESALRAAPIEGRITLSGYEGSELLVGRLLAECGADLRYVGTALPRTRFSDRDREWLEARGVEVRFRASLEQDLAAMRGFEPHLVIGTTPVVQQASIPALYFTNLISARPLVGPAGVGSLSQIVRNAIAGQRRFDEMSAFFDGVGVDRTAGIWSRAPEQDVLASPGETAKSPKREDSLKEAMGC